MRPEGIPLTPEKTTAPFVKPKEWAAAFHATNQQHTIQEQIRFYILYTLNCGMVIIDFLKWSKISRTTTANVYISG